MIKYYDDKNVAIVDDYVFNRDKKTGYYLSSRKIGDKKKRLHQKLLSGRAQDTPASAGGGRNAPMHLMHF